MFLLLDLTLHLQHTTQGQLMQATTSCDFAAAPIAANALPATPTVGSNERCNCTTTASCHGCNCAAIHLQPQWPQRRRRRSAGCVCR